MPRFGWSAHTPVALLEHDALGFGAAGDAWRPALLRSPVAAPGTAMLRARDGRVEVLTGRELARPSDRFRAVDLRRRLLTLAPQSIAVLEGVDVAVTAAIGVRTTDPVAFATSAADPDAEVYLAVQIALRDAVALAPLDAVLVRELDMRGVVAAAHEAAAGVGLTVDSVVLKDVRAPRALEAAREEAVVVDLRSRIELERARGEVKATRARLASAQMLDRSPVLARVRLLEALPPGTSLTVADGALGPAWGIGRGGSAEAGGAEASDGSDGAED